MGNNKKNPEIDWEERLFQTTLAFITEKEQNIHELSLGQVTKIMRKAKTFIKYYKYNLKDGYFSDLIDD